MLSRSTASGGRPKAVAVLNKLPPDQLRDPHNAVYAALILDDDNQVEAANQYVSIARAGHLFPEEKQLLEEIAGGHQGVSPTASPAEPSPTPR